VPNPKRQPLRDPLLESDPHLVAPRNSLPNLRPSVREWILAIVLLIGTILSTTWLAGVSYAAALLLILFCHEMGHYLTARHYRVRTTLPFFLPFPLSPFGTMGAIILMRERIRTRRILFDVGIAGPLAGIPPALAACLWGLAHSRVVDAAGFPPQDRLHLGSSLLFRALERSFFPQLHPGEDVFLHPVAFAGWAGLFVTSLNLLPIGQLDGGHILYGLLGRGARRFSWLIALAIAAAGFWYPGWWVLLGLLLLTRLRHPHTDDESAPLGRGRIALGLLALLIFVLTFIPRPIRVF
jgi:membrane-associated protease RseP (regulator of RpoE activity)